MPPKPEDLNPGEGDPSSHDRAGKGGHAHSQRRDEAEETVEVKPIIRGFCSTVWRGSVTSREANEVNGPEEEEGDKNGAVGEKAARDTFNDKEAKEQHTSEATEREKNKKLSQSKALKFPYSKP